MPRPDAHSLPSRRGAADGSGRRPEPAYPGRQAVK